MCFRKGQNARESAACHTQRARNTHESRVTPGRIKSPRGGVTSSTPPSGFLKDTNRFMVPTSVRESSSPVNHKFWLYPSFAASDWGTIPGA